MLQGVSLVAEPGRTTAIIGSTGSGKSTLLSLIPRLYDVTDGAVLLGGVDVRDATLEDVWAGIGLVPQKPYLFTGTVASNLRYGDADATDDELWEALRIAQAEDFVRAMPDGLESADRPGRHERLRRPAPAPGHRAGARAPSPTSTSSTTASPRSTSRPTRGCGRHCRPVTRHTTVVVVAQRVSTIIDADHIVVLEDGAVVGPGTHDELLETCPTYLEIVESQRSAEEAAA